MIKDELVFDWKQSESQGKSKIIAFLLVTVLFTVLVSLLDLRLSPFRNESFVGAELIRFDEEEMARSWLLEAEERGPFPGRLEVVDELSLLAFSGGGLSSWNDYSVRLRSLHEEQGVARMEIATKGARVFPAIPSPSTDVLVDIPQNSTMRRKLILTPYDADALKWMPSKGLPEFQVPAGVESMPDALRFVVSVRDDGTVAESISLGGGADPLQDAVEVWLRSIRFGRGAGERWIGLRVDFVNGRKNGAEPE
jgi:hypothetical protein